MKAITLKALQEMRKRGFDESVIAAQYDLNRSELAQQLLVQIQNAFKDVTLGNGVGLYQAQALDDYRTKDEEAAARFNDEKSDWSKISSQQLNQCNSSLSFFDPEGMRFHLPAYLTAELNGEYGFGMAFCLTFLEYGDSNFQLLSGPQRLAIRNFLEFLRDDADYEYERSNIIEALESYWTEASCH